MNPTPELHPPARKRSLRLVAAGAVAALVLAPLAVIGANAAVGSAKSASSRAVSAVLGSGVMTKFPNGFRPNDAATREQLALALHRSMPRIAVGGSLASIPNGASNVLLGDNRIKVDGAPGKRQGVLITVMMQLDHDSPVPSCTASFALTRNTDPTILGSWSQELYADPDAGMEDNIAFSIFVTQPTNTSHNYHLLGSNNCGQTLFTDQDVWYAQTYPLAGNGKAFPPPAPPKAPVTPKHDR